METTAQKLTAICREAGDTAGLPGMPVNRRTQQKRHEQVLKTAHEFTRKLYWLYNR